METHCEEIMTTLPNKICSGNHKATEEEGDHEIFEDIWIQKWEQQNSSTAGRRWRLWVSRCSLKQRMMELNTELDGDKCSVAYVPLGATWHKSSQVKH